MADLPKSDDPSKRRITIGAARKMLGMIGRNYDDAEIQDILAGLYAIAEEAHDAYRREQPSDPPPPEAP